MRGKGLILALDVADGERAMAVAGSTSRYLEAIKVGYPLVLSSGLEVISELKSYRKPIIADFKIADIPYTSRLICHLAREAGADFVIVHGFVGEDVVKACSEVVDILVVAEMSHEGARSFIQPVSERIAKMAKRYARGIIAPATRAESIKKLRNQVGEELAVICPGVKVQGSRVGDAIRAGANYEIVGRAIYESSSPAREAKEIAEAIQKL